MPQLRGIYEKVPGSGSWWIRWTDSEGKLHREKAGRRSDAKTLIEKRRTEVLQRKKLPELARKRVTFQTLCDDALEYSNAHNAPKVTYDLELRFNYMAASFGDRDATKITKQEVTRWLVENEAGREWSAATRNRYQAAFSLVYRVAEENKKVTANPAAKIKRKNEQNEIVRYLSKSEEQALRNAIQERFPQFLPQLDISIHTGVRSSEQFRIKWTDINFELDPPVLTVTKSKNGKKRYIPLNSVALAAFLHLKETSKGNLVFPSTRIEGEPLQGTRGWFDTAVSAANVMEYTWHCNRHSFASRLVQAGVSLHTVAELLGHESLEMTKRYAHLAPEHNAAAVRKLEPVSEIQTGTTTGTST